MSAKDVKKRITLKLNNPSSTAVFVAGSFNNWDPSSKAMKKDTKGIWKAILMLSPGIYEYRFVVDGVWLDDPENPEKNLNEFGSFNSVLKV